MPGTKLSFVQEFLRSGAAGVRQRRGQPAADVRALRHAVVRQRSAHSAAWSARWRRKRRSGGARQRDAAGNAVEGPRLPPRRKASYGTTRQRPLARRRHRPVHRSEGARVPAHVAAGDPRAHSRRHDAGRPSHRARGGRIVHNTRAGAVPDACGRASPSLIPNLPRRAQVIYPKDIGPILMWGDIYPGARSSRSGIGPGA